MPGSSPIITGTWRGHEVRFRNDRIIISVANNVPEVLIQDTVDTVVAQIPGAAKDRFRPGRRWATIAIPPGTNVIQVVSQIAARSDIRYAEPDFLLFGRATPNDPEYATGIQKWPDLINLAQAWDHTQGDEHVLLRSTMRSSPTSISATRCIRWLMMRTVAISRGTRIHPIIGSITTMLTMTTNPKTSTGTAHG
jgi:hypothetical protein